MTTTKRTRSSNKRHCSARGGSIPEYVRMKEATGNYVYYKKVDSTPTTMNVPTVQQTTLIGG